MTIYQNLIAGSGFLQGPTGATGPAANTNITVYEYVASAGQTTFTGDDVNLINLSYTPTGIFVTLNGSVLNDTTDFIATDGESIVLTQAAAVNDELNIYTFPAFNVSGTYTQAEVNALLSAKLNLTGGTITGNVSFANGTSLLIPVGNTAQRPAATPGHIRYNTDLNTLESANSTAWANVGSGSASSGGGGVTWTPAVQNTGFIAIKNSGYLVNTATGNVTVTLPASPTIGDNITFVDYGGTFSSNALIFYPNGSKINANTINVALTTSTASIGLVYTDANKGWVAYNGFQSSPIGNYTVEYLVVAGGGGGASGYCSGGGGAGGMLTGTTTIISGISYPVTIGSGGGGVAGGSTWPASTKGSPGGSSSVSNIATAIGGGGAAGNDSGAGLSGGSGGGGAATRTNGAGGAGTAGQGNPGAAGNVGQASHGGGGGGGAGGAGTVGTDSAGGTGGVGATSSISGSSVYYAGGGGGGTYYNVPTPGSGGPGGPGGNGGGGAGGSYPGTRPGASGTNALGAGGGGGAGFDSPTIAYNGGNGGSGVVILRYLGPQRASGGDTITFSGGYTIHTFTSSGTFRP